MSSLVTVCPCHQFVLENCQETLIYTCKGLEKPGIEPATPGLQVEWVNLCAMEASVSHPQCQSLEVAVTSENMENFIVTVCEPPVQLDFGQYVLSDNGITVKYSCFSGYTLSGASERRCGANSTGWSGSDPVCGMILRYEFIAVKKLNLVSLTKCLSIFYPLSKRLQKEWKTVTVNFLLYVDAT